MAPVPQSVPQLGLEEIEKILNHRRNRERVCVVALRGYYLDSMGKPGENDRGIYDDALFIVETDGLGTVLRAHRYNANTDPSIHRPGIANLKAGSWRYKPGIHGLSKPKNRQYPAFVQAAPVVVERDGGKVESGYFGINIHRGSQNSTSSEGCQTIHPSQWDSFHDRLVALLKSSGQQTFGYELMDESDRRKYLGGA